MTPSPTGHTVDPSWVPDAPLSPPTSNGGLLDVFRRRYVLKLIERDGHGSCYDESE